jgi:hypothetical protein
MTDPRKPIFDAIRAARGKGFSDAEVQQVDAVLDGLGVPGGVVLLAPAPQPASDIPDDYWPMLSKIESGDRPYVKAGSSSASGLYQFIKSTWIGEGGRWGGDMSQAFGGLRPSVEEQLQRARTFTEKNADYLRRVGVPINKASLYAAHFFGAGTAAKVIKADVDSRADHIAGKAATDANPSILRGKTVGQFLAWLHKKTGDWAR